MGGRSNADYYAVALSGERLRQCYEVAPPRVRQYLDAEIGFVQSRIGRGESVLELGCGYGRIAFRLAEVAGRVVGVDTSSASLDLARSLAVADSGCEFLEMDASALSFPDSEFDAVVCAQNGICAFGADREQLLREALRVLRPGGRALFSTYSAKFWRPRLEWFEAQAAGGLIGEIDMQATGDGTIVCKDGLRLAALSPDGFLRLGAAVGVTPEIVEVDGSSVFGVWHVDPAR